MLVVCAACFAPYWRLCACVRDWVTTCTYTSNAMPCVTAYALSSPALSYPNVPVYCADAPLGPRHLCACPFCNMYALESKHRALFEVSSLLKDGYFVCVIRVVTEERWSAGVCFHGCRYLCFGG